MYYDSVHRFSIGVSISTAKKIISLLIKLNEKRKKLKFLSYTVVVLSILLKNKKKNGKIFNSSATNLLYSYINTTVAYQRKQSYHWAQ